MAEAQAYVFLQDPPGESFCGQRFQRKRDERQVRSGRFLPTKRNDFSGAKSALSGISGKHQGRRSNLSTKDPQTMNKLSPRATALPMPRTIRGAVNSYTEAASVKSDGPGRPAWPYQPDESIGRKRAAVPVGRCQQQSSRLSPTIILRP